MNPEELLKFTLLPQNEVCLVLLPCTLGSTKARAVRVLM